MSLAMNLLAECLNIIYWILIVGLLIKPPNLMQDYYRGRIISKVGLIFQNAFKQQA